jgi:hypothetical protein
MTTNTTPRKRTVPTGPAVPSNVANVSTVIRNWDAMGRTFTDARNAAVGRALATGVKPAVVVTETGLDKGDVSRIGKATRLLTAPQKKRLLGLSLPISDADMTSSEFVSSFADFGSKFYRRAKGVSKVRTPEVKGPDALFGDAIAAAFDLIVENPDRASAWLALAADLFTPEKVADRVAEIATASEEAAA